MTFENENTERELPLINGKVRKTDKLYTPGASMGKILHDNSYNSACNIQFSTNTLDMLMAPQKDKLIKTNFEGTQYPEVNSHCKLFKSNFPLN